MSGKIFGISISLIVIVIATVIITRKFGGSIPLVKNL